MIFGETPLDQAEAAILAHSLRRDSIIFKKGRVLSAEDVARLAAAGVEQVVAARLEPGDGPEHEAAGALAAALTGDHLTASAAFTGRCNLLVQTRGLLLVDHANLDQLNLDQMQRNARKWLKKDLHVSSPASWLRTHPCSAQLWRDVFCLSMPEKRAAHTQQRHV